jgi:hypothetical protein
MSNQRVHVRVNCHDQVSNVRFHPCWFAGSLARQSSQEILPVTPSAQSIEILPYITHDVRRLSQHGVIQRARGDILEFEAEATRFVRTNTSIPVPEVYDFWIDVQGRGNLTMKLIEGKNLL